MRARRPRSQASAVAREGARNNPSPALGAGLQGVAESVAAEAATTFLRTTHATARIL